MTGLLLTTACSGHDGRDSQSPRGKEYVDAVASAIEDGAPGLGEEGRCLGAGWVDVVGLDALDKAGVTPDEFANLDSSADLKLSDRQARQATDVFFGCFDVAKLFILDEHTEKDRECIRTAIKNSNGELREIMKQSLLGSEDADLTDAVSQLVGDKCGVSIYVD